MTLKNKPVLDSRGLFLAISDLLQNDNSYVDETLRNQGVNPENLESKGNAFLRKLVLQNQLSEKSSKKTALIEKLTQALQFIQNSSNLISSALLPEKQETSEQLYTLLCNKFKEFSPEDIKSIMQDEAILLELEKLSTDNNQNEKRS